MAISVRAYLEAQGFSEHPFETTSAERESATLPSFFVRGEHFDWLVGDPARPESRILFAPRGYGKTSHRVELGRSVAQRREAAALVVTIDDPAPLLEAQPTGGAAGARLGAHLTLIRRRTLEALDKQLLRPVRQARFAEDPLARARLFALTRLYAPRTVWGREAPPGADAYAAAVQAEQRGPKEWLKELSELVALAGFASVYCLFDCFDELEETSGEPAAIFELVRPLLENPGLLHECAFAFRFFLPYSLEAYLKEHSKGRLDRTPSRTLTWSEQQLRAMLGNRLVAYSRLDAASSFARVRSFSDLCAEAFDADQLLVQAGEGSPRTLITRARTIIEEHCRLANSVEERIARSVFTAVCGPATQSTLIAADRAAETAVTAAETSVVAASTPASPPPASEPMPQGEPAQNGAVATGNVPLLSIDSRGDIWLGDRRLTIDLPGLQRNCLEYLWAHRQRRVTFDELIDALYGSTVGERGDPQGSVVKLVRRLQAALNPDGRTGHIYIKLQAGRGYVLQNYAERRPG